MSETSARLLRRSICRQRARQDNGTNVRARETRVESNRPTGNKAHLVELTQVEVDHRGLGREEPHRRPGRCHHIFGAATGTIDLMLRQKSQRRREATEPGAPSQAEEQRGHRHRRRSMWGIFTICLNFAITKPIRSDRTYVT